MRISFMRQIFQMVSISTFEILKLAMYDKLSNSIVQDDLFLMLFCDDIERQQLK